MAASSEMDFYLFDFQTLLQKFRLWPKAIVILAFHIQLTILWL